MAKKSHNVLPLSEKLKVPVSIRKEGKSYTEENTVCYKNESSTLEIVKKGKEMHGNLAVTPQTAKVKTTVYTSA